MAQVKELIQQHIGSGPVLKALIQKMGFIPIIDRNLPVDPRRVGPMHGEAVAGMVACLLQGICALYRMEQFAAAESVLQTLFPHYEAGAWHDDPLGDTLDAIWKFGPGALQGAVTAHLLEHFDVRVDQCNPRLQAEKQAVLERCLQKTQVFLEGLTKRLGKRALKSREAITQLLETTLKRDHTRDLLTYDIVSTETTRQRYRGRGRPGAGAFYAEVSQVHWTVAWQWLPSRRLNCWAATSPRSRTTRP